MNATGRPFQFNLCIWGNANVWDWGARVVSAQSSARCRISLFSFNTPDGRVCAQGHSWRMSGDAGATWSYIMSIMKTNVQHLDAIDFFSHNDM